MIGTITRDRGGENREVIKENNPGGRENLDRKNQRSNTCKSHNIRLKTRKTTSKFYQAILMFKNCLMTFIVKRFSKSSTKSR